MEIANKKIFITIGKWIAFWGIWASIDLYFDIAMLEIIFTSPIFYMGLIGIAFTLLTSMFEARYFYYKNANEYLDPYNEHTLFTFIRITFLIPILISVGWIPVLCYAAAFPFLHDGMYYYRRNKLNPLQYPKGWFDQSTTSKAFLTKYMTPVVRTILFVLSIAGLIVWYNLS
jgi:hypothetical protein